MSNHTTVGSYSIGSIGNIGAFVPGPVHGDVVTGQVVTTKVDEDDDDDEVDVPTARVITGNVIQGLTFGNNNNSVTTFVTHGAGPSTSSSFASNVIFGNVAERTMPKATNVITFNTTFDDVTVAADTEADEIVVTTDMGEVKVLSGCKVHKLLVKAGTKRVVVEEGVVVDIIEVTTGSGDVRIETKTPPTRIVVTSKFGNILVPRGTKAERVRVEMGTASVTLGGKGVILQTGVGNIGYV